MKPDGLSLVVGTTADYIEWIEHHCETPTVFLTAQRERKRASGKYRTPRLEMVADLSDVAQCLWLVQNYIHSTPERIVSIVCFDDEALLLAATLAKQLELPFPSPEAVRQCLDKQTAKQVWRANGLLCPTAISVSASLKELDAGGLDFPCVLKPHSGSGSEHVFLCNTVRQAKQAAKTIIASSHHGATNATAVAETLITGTEYSCDFVIQDGTVHILRTAGKCMAPDAPMGTALAYILPASLPPKIRGKLLPAALRKATESLGILHATCMADFMVEDDKIYLLEISPRIGGDCLPHILRDAWGIDAISTAMGYSRGGAVKAWLKESAPTVVGLRVFAPRAGTVIAVDTRGLADDPRVISHHLDGCRGRTVVLPPADYSTWLLGHVVFQPYAAGDVRDQIYELRKRIHIQFEDDPRDGGS